MIQFIPQLVTEKQQIDTIQLAKQIKQQEGVQAYMYFKKLSIMAMYGSMILGYIDYISFLSDVERHLQRNESIFAFWGIKNPHHERGNKYVLYGVDVKIFNQTPLHLLPTIIQQHVQRGTIKEKCKGIII